MTGRVDLDSDTYVCAVCEREFDKEVSDAEALAASIEEGVITGREPLDDLSVVCDDCYPTFREWFENEYRKS